jgi:urea transport system permease protein
MSDILNQLFTGLSIASILLLVSLGLAIIYGTMGVINLAHGEFVMLGAYTVWYLQKTLGLDLLPCLLISFFAVAAAGWVIERLIVRHLYKRPLDTILATWGVGVILQQGIRLTAGPELRYVKMPAWLANAVPVLGVEVSAYRIFIFVLTVALLAVTYFLLARTRYGFSLRAVTQNPEVSRCFGINAARVYSLTFAYGAGLAGIAGALIAPLKSVSPDMGTGTVIDAFMVVVVGGVASLIGTVASAAIIGQVSGILAFIYNDTLAKALVFFGVVILIRFMPEGIFAVRVRRG